jgi:hypothetical protein
MTDKPPTSKQERVGLILAALRDGPAAASRDEALALLDRAFRMVEDEQSGVSAEPFDARRLYPPVTSMERRVEGRPELRRYRHTGHYTLNRGEWSDRNSRVRAWAAGRCDGHHRRTDRTRQAGRGWAARDGLGIELRNKSEQPIFHGWNFQ